MRIRKRLVLGQEISMRWLGREGFSLCWRRNGSMLLHIKYSVSIGANWDLSTQLPTTAFQNPTSGGGKIPMTKTPSLCSQLINSWHCSRSQTANNSVATATSGCLSIRNYEIFLKGYISCLGSYDRGWYWERYQFQAKKVGCTIDEQGPQELNQDLGDHWTWCGEAEASPRGTAKKQKKRDKK